MKMRFAVLLATVAATGSLTHSLHAQAKPLTELQHIDVTRVDSSVSPCDNFYQYACGKLNAANPIPPDQMAWGVGGELAAWNREVLLQILEKNEAASNSRTPNEQKIGDFYSTCMVQASAKKDDLSTIQPLLARIRDMRNKRDIASTRA